MDWEESSSESESGSGSRGNPFSRIPKLGLGMVATFLDYIHLRLTLFGIEAREARLTLIGGFALLISGLLFILIGWVAFWVGLIPIIARSSGMFWGGVTMLVALFHVLFGVLFIYLGKTKFSRSLFEDTHAEFQKDREWIEKNRSLRR